LNFFIFSSIRPSSSPGLICRAGPDFKTIRYTLTFDPKN
jgi:hypothetical protein